MNKTYRLLGFVLLGVAASTVTGIVCEAKRRRNLRRLIDAANEGYETAHDIIYPGQNASYQSRKLRYGPVF